VHNRTAPPHAESLDADEMYQATLDDNYHHHTIQIVLHYNEWHSQTNIFWEARAVPLPSFHEKLLLLI